MEVLRTINDILRPIAIILMIALLIKLHKKK